MNFSEIRHDYIWGPAVENGANGGHDLLAAVSIDAWKSADDNEEGEVLANVLLTAHGDMIVDFHDNGVRMHQPVLDHIRAAEETLKQIWQEKVCQYSGKIVCATVLTIPRSVMDQINRFLSQQFRGGTDLASCFRAIMERLQSREWFDADAVVISDFIAQRLPDDVTSKVKELQRVHQHRFHAVAMSAHGKPGIMRIFDHIWRFDTGMRSRLLRRWRR